MIKLSMIGLLLSVLMLQACSVSSLDQPLVTIGYLEREELAPAHWVFKADTRVDVLTYRWSFSDQNFAALGGNTSESVSHVFENPGLHRVRLEYTTLNGNQGVVENDVVVGAGSISGVLLAAAGNLVDVDTRDPVPSLENNSFDNAQAISATSQLSGIVDEEDPEDFYQLQLQAFQGIDIQIAEAKNSGLYARVLIELFSSEDKVNEILSAQTRAIDGRLSASLLVPETGSYFIKITALNPSTTQGGDNPIEHSHGIYSLAFQLAANSTNAEFALGEVNIMLKPERAFQTQGLRSRMDLGRIKNLSLADAQSFLAANNIQYQKQSIPLNAQSHWETLQVVELLSAHEDILFAEPNWKRTASALPALTDPFAASQWHYNSINVEGAWQALDSRGSSSVTVAVLDTGVLTAHPDLSANLVAGYDYVGDGSLGSEDADPNDPGDKTISGQRSSFHGTHVAGTIAAAANNIGGTGIAPNVKIMPIRVLGAEGGFASDIIAGVCFAAQLTQSNSAVCANSNASSFPADIINLSLGGPGFSNIEQAVYDAAIDKGIIVIAAAGNESTSSPSYPAAYEQVISVAAIGRTLNQASYSNFGSTIDVAAPGGDFAVDSGVLSTWGDDLSGPAILTYGSLQGTSMAAPHVAGVAALMKSAQADLTHNEFLGHLSAGHLTQDLGEAGRDDIFGHGLIDAQKAILQIQQDAGPQILSSNNYLYFNVSQLSLNFVLTSAGVEADSALGDIVAEIQSIGSANSDWLSLDRTTGLGSYTASINRDGLIEGSYQANIKISSSLVEVEDLVISVQLQVGNPELSANAGVQYIVIIDADAEADENGIFPTVGGSSALIPQNGEYSYQLYGLKKGRYLVSSGSDLDFDNIICDAGESCGQYPTLDQPSAIEISESQPHLMVNMTVNYVSSGLSNLTNDNNSVNSPVRGRAFSAYKISTENALSTKALKTNTLGQ